jgi:NAD(P)-dependent dehydrogenase (short-subunit alcohol dehydrogenase family)/acyl carrier protein
VDWKFDECGTYLIAGGLGGVGRSIMTWMASRGAKNLIVPSRWSRSVAASKAAIDVVAKLKKQGVYVATPRCDVSSESSLRAVLDECAATMPPIKGCINAAMVLNDSVFDNMTHAQWTQTLDSKVATSWNLHQCLPQDLDFFVLLSSVAGVIGSAGQANYATGCTFQDALARHRVVHGQKAVSIDLGVMRSIGVVAETGKLQRTFENAKGMKKIEEGEFLALLDIQCDPKRPIAEPDKSQMSIGLVTPADMIAQGDEPIEMLQRPLFGNFAEPRAGTNHAYTAGISDYGAVFKQAGAQDERARIVVTALAQKLARALSVQPEDIDSEKTLHVFGVDSLVAVELRSWIAKEFAADVTVFDLMGSASVSAIGYLVAKVSKLS